MRGIRISEVKRACALRREATSAERKMWVGLRNRALDDLDSGDELVIAEWDRATRSMWDGLQIMKAAIDAGAGIQVLDPLHRP